MIYGGRCGGAGWVGAGRTPSSRKTRTRWIHRRTDVLASAKLVATASMAPVSRYAIGAMKIGKLREPRRDRGRLVALSRRSGIGVGRLVSRRRALARSDGGLSGLRCSIVPPARRSLWGEEE